MAGRRRAHNEESIKHQSMPQGKFALPESLFVRFFNATSDFISAYFMHVLSPASNVIALWCIHA